MIYNGDALDVMRGMKTESINCCVTSPPYYGLRDYGIKEQIGLECTLDLYVQKIVEVFREVKRLLRADGTLWLNIGDSYTGSGKGAAKYPENAKKYKQGTNKGTVGNSVPCKVVPLGFKPKELMGIPWRVAFALQADGWYLRQDIIWSKPNPMPESVTDRCTKSHEYLFLLSKKKNYYFDSEVMKEKAEWDHAKTKFPDGWDTGEGGHGAFHRDGREKGRKNTASPRYGGKKYTENPDVFYRTKSGHAYDYRTFRNKRDVWTVAAQPCKEPHFATFPEDLIRPCIKAGSPIGGTVLDPFIGSGTTAVVCIEEHRNYIGIEIHPKYIEIAQRRIKSTERTGLLFATKPLTEATS